MGVKDVIKKSVLEGFNSDISLIQVLLALGITAILALFIYFVYRLVSDSNFYSKDFNKTMVCMSIVTAGIVLAMQSNIVISLGMVGALSIVRFRNAVKNPLDLLFLFWSISIGIVCGAGIYTVAFMLSAVVTVIIFVLEILPSPKAPYILVINAARKDAETELVEVMNKYSKGAKIRTRNITAAGANYVIELQTKQEQELVDACDSIEGITSVSLMAHDGEVRY